MGMVTGLYALVAGVVGGFIGAFIITLIRWLRKPDSSVGSHFSTFLGAFFICGLICAAVTVLFFVNVFTGGFN